MVKLKVQTSQQWCPIYLVSFNGGIFRLRWETPVIVPIYRNNNQEAIRDNPISYTLAVLSTTERITECKPTNYFLHNGNANIRQRSFLWDKSIPTIIVGFLSLAARAASDCKLVIAISLNKTEAFDQISHRKPFIKVYIFSLVISLFGLRNTGKEYRWKSV